MNLNTGAAPTAMRGTLARIGYFSTGARLAQLALRAVTVPLSISLLGTENYGYWLAIGSFTAWFTVSDLGIGQIALSRLAERAGDGDAAGARAVVAFANRLYLTLAMALATAFLLAYAASASSNLLAGESRSAPRTAIDLCFLAAGLSLAVATALNAAAILNQATLKVERIYVANTVSPLVSLIVLSVYRLTGAPISLAGYAGVMSLPPILSAAGLYLFTFTRERSFRPSGEMMERIPAKRLIASSASLIVIQLCDLAIFYTPVVYVTRTMGPTAAAVYGVTASIFMIGVNLCFGWGQPHIAAYTIAMKDRNTAWIAAQHRSLLLRTIGAFAVGAAILIVAGQFLIGVYTAHHIDVPQHLIAWMAAFYTLIVASQQNGFLLLGLGMEKWRAILQTANAIALLAGLFTMGRTGALWLIFPLACISLAADAFLSLRFAGRRL
ncbi:MAG: hypothetical protein HYX27_06730 [Acidobacteria bacterium]|nr:hypothetical protein [Acidobacteriota bacterium]